MPTPPIFAGTSEELPSTPPQPTFPSNSGELPSTPPPPIFSDTSEEFPSTPAPPTLAEAGEELPFSLPADEVPVEPVSPVCSSPHSRPRQSPGSPSDVPSGSRQIQTDKSPTDSIAKEWRRATGRVSPSRDDMMLHKGATDETEDVEESDDGMGHPIPPPIIIVGSPSPSPSLSEIGEEPSDPDLLSRALLPCTRFDDVQDQVHTLFDLVWAALPRCPKIYELGQLKGTKVPTSTEYDIPESHQLRNIVFCRNMLAPVETQVAELLHAIPFDRTNEAHMLFATRVFPWFTSRGSPKRIYSEVDTEDWIRDTLIGPAHAVIHAVMLGHIPDDVSPEYPFHSSAHCRFANRPDNMTILEGEHPNETISHLGEWKTTGVISIADNPLSGVQNPVENITRLGAAYKFNWPVPSATIMQRDKILCQVGGVFLDELGVF
ncbi:hypothetical protein EWM64_g4103 [Hericium alpestre]|uniref:Uncharacterized protein n=1 Tax=Hericium alpestre TaxID=135208 RepID=A0A4Y9ZYK9_9AGAM|nr:hypothetical protein EWM64_g4103 [Hericium alpestre]